MTPEDAREVLLKSARKAATMRFDRQTWERMAPLDALDLLEDRELNAIVEIVWGTRRDSEPPAQ